MSTSSNSLQEATRFLVAGGMRPRAVVVTGDPGIGKTRFLDLLQVELLAAGKSEVIVVDDAHLLEADAVATIRERLAGDSRTRLVAAVDTSSCPLVAMVDRTCERRIVDLQPLAEDQSRALLVELGHEPWSFRVAQALQDAGGNPRRLIDASSLQLDVDRLPVDTTFDGSTWNQGAADRLRHAICSDPATYEAFVDQMASIAAAGDPSSREHRDAMLVTSEVALLADDLETAIQLGERVAAAADAQDDERILAASFAASARALRGEPTAILSLHALAGRASRARMPIVESVVWHSIAWCAGINGDVATAERAAVRSLQLADRADALTLAVRARNVLAQLHLAANRPQPARAYLEEILLVAEARELHNIRMSGMSDLARACLAAGDNDAACRLSDDALQLMLRTNVSRMDLVCMSVIAARAYAAAGSVDLALAPLDALATDLGDSHSPDFWLVLEAVRVLGAAGTDPAKFKSWLARMAEFDADGHGGALRAAHAEVDAWRAAIEGRRAEAARLAERARQLWITAECHDELPLTEPIIQQAPLEHGPRISLVGSASGVAAPAEDPEAFAVLTKREREIARYVAGGLTNPEIAGELHLSPRTVEHHVASILRKLELPSRRALVRGQV